MGKAVPGSSARTLATEAVFSKNGNVKKRIKNFETTIVDTSENVLVFPSSSDDIDIPQVLDSVSSLGLETANPSRSSVRHGVLLIGFIVTITFSWSIYSLFFAVKDPEQIANSVHENDTRIQTNPVTEDTLGSLKRSANMLLEKTVWEAADIDIFLRHWNSLTEQDIQKTTKTTWYQLLEYQVKKQIVELQVTKTAKTVSHSNDRALMTLGLVMGLHNQADSDGETVASSTPEKTQPDNREKYNQLLVEISQELANAEKRTSQIARSNESESALNAKLRQKYGAAKSDFTNAPAINNSSETSTVAMLAKPENQAVNVNSQNARQATITRNEIDTVVLNYKNAYEKGDLTQMARLFGANDKNSNKYKTVFNNFDSTFNNTTSRSINFYDTSSNVLKDRAVVETQYNASVEFRNGKGVQYTVASVRFHLAKLGDQVVVNRVDTLDRKVNVISTQAAKVTSSNGMISALDNNISFPTAAELQDITTQLVTSYETGNLEHFLSLFSQEIKTNDRIDLSGVRQDYSQLFKTTSDRQMFIQNLKWTNENIGAKGTGDLEVIVFSDEGKAVYSMEGKIQIVAQKLDNKVKITHLYHIEREK